MAGFNPKHQTSLSVEEILKLDLKARARQLAKDGLDPADAIAHISEIKKQFIRHCQNYLQENGQTQIPQDWKVWLQQNASISLDQMSDPEKMVEVLDEAYAQALQEELSSGEKRGEDYLASHRPTTSNQKQVDIEERAQIDKQRQESMRALVKEALRNVSQTDAQNPTEENPAVKALTEENIDSFVHQVNQKASTQDLAQSFSTTLNEFASGDDRWKSVVEEITTQETQIRGKTLTSEQAIQAKFKRAAATKKSTQLSPSQQNLVALYQTINPESPVKAAQVVKNNTTTTEAVSAPDTSLEETLLIHTLNQQGISIEESDLPLISQAVAASSVTDKAKQLEKIPSLKGKSQIATAAIEQTTKAVSTQKTSSGFPEVVLTTHIAAQAPQATSRQIDKAVDTLQDKTLSNTQKSSKIQEDLGISGSRATTLTKDLSETSTRISSQTQPPSHQLLDVIIPPDKKESLPKVAELKSAPEIEAALNDMGVSPLVSKKAAQALVQETSTETSVPASQVSKIATHAAIGQTLGTSAPADSVAVLTSSIQEKIDTQSGSLTKKDIEAVVKEADLPESVNRSQVTNEIYQKHQKFTKAYQEISELSDSPEKTNARLVGKGILTPEEADTLQVFQDTTLAGGVAGTLLIQDSTRPNQFEIHETIKEVVTSQLTQQGLSPEQAKNEFEQIFSTETENAPLNLKTHNLVDASLLSGASSRQTAELIAQTAGISPDSQRFNETLGKLTVLIDEHRENRKQLTNSFTVENYYEGSYPLEHGFREPLNAQLDTQSVVGLIQTAGEKPVMSLYLARHSATRPKNVQLSNEAERFWVLSQEFTIAPLPPSDMRALLRPTFQSGALQGVRYRWFVANTALARNSFTKRTLLPLSLSVSRIVGTPSLLPSSGGVPWLSMGSGVQAGGVAGSSGGFGSGGIGAGVGAGLANSAMGRTAGDLAKSLGDAGPNSLLKKGLDAATSGLSNLSSLFRSQAGNLLRQMMMYIIGLITSLITSLFTALIPILIPLLMVLAVLAIVFFLLSFLIGDTVPRVESDEYFEIDKYVMLATFDPDCGIEEDPSCYFPKFDDGEVAFDGIGVWRDQNGEEVPATKELHYSKEEWDQIVYDNDRIRRFKYGVSLRIKDVEVGLITGYGAQYSDIMHMQALNKSEVLLYPKFGSWPALLGQGTEFIDQQFQGSMVEYLLPIGGWEINSNIEEYLGIVEDDGDLTIIEPEFTDLAIYNRVSWDGRAEVPNLDNPESGELQLVQFFTTDTAVIKIGNAPDILAGGGASGGVGCFVFDSGWDNLSSAFVPDAKQQLQTAAQHIMSKPGAQDLICNGGDVTIYDEFSYFGCTSWNGDGTPNESCNGVGGGGLNPKNLRGTTIILGPRAFGAGGWIRTSIYTLAHEASHSIEYRNSFVTQCYLNSGAESESRATNRNLPILPSYPTEVYGADPPIATLQFEAPIEAMGAYLSLPEEISLLDPFATRFPQNYAFAQDVFNGGCI